MPTSSSFVGMSLGAGFAGFSVTMGSFINIDDKAKSTEQGG